MRFIFGLWTMAVALTVSVVAAYYSIIGLTAIFAAAFIPIIIMGATLEIAKVTAAVWLHSFWIDASILIKAYLLCAIVILMLITSMGIFGFLSKAHIEQAADSGSVTAQIDRLDQEIVRQQQGIERANVAISNFDNRVDDADINIQGRIESQERIIADIATRLERDIFTQNQMITQELSILSPLQEELNRVREQRQELSTARQAKDIRTLQALVGAKVDGVSGPNTRQRITEYQQRLDSRQSEILSELERLQTSDNPAVQQARIEITRLQQAANAEIARAQEAINSFRNQLVSVTTADNSEGIGVQEAIIVTANNKVDEILTRKFELESELRILEVEVGPVKYIAELIYGETNPDLLEEAVRWVIVLIVLVFDPLAIVLVLAGLSILHRKIKSIDIPPEMPHNDTVQPEPEEPASETMNRQAPDDKPASVPSKSPPLAFTAKEQAEQTASAHNPSDSKDKPPGYKGNTNAITLAGRRTGKSRKLPQNNRIINDK